MIKKVVCECGSTDVLVSTRFLGATKPETWCGCNKCGKNWVKTD